MKKSKHFLFHYLLKQFQIRKLTNKHLLVAVSGGVDSMTLLSVLWEVRNILNLHISVIHVHHGAKDKNQRQFQDHSVKTVKSFWQDLMQTNLHQARFEQNERSLPPEHSHLNKGKTGQKKPMSNWTCATKPIIIEGKTGQKKHNVLKPSIKKLSEAEMRKHRYQAFSDCLKKSKADYLLLAHTADDLLETRLIRLIRGTGEQGLKAMSFKNHKLIRPFIHINRFQIMDYARKTKLKWCEDPSNQSTEYSFRNWIRQKWLPLLEEKRPGSVKALSKSLDLMSHQAQKSQKRIKTIYQGLIKTHSLRRDIISTFSVVDRQKILAYYVKQQGFKNYRTSHILELLKHISRPQKKFRFSLLGQTWKMDAQWISLEKKKNNERSVKNRQEKLTYKKA